MRRIYKWIFIFLIIWISIEVGYQFYLRSKWIRKGNYNWEYYALLRNENRITEIDSYFKSFKGKYFFYSINPDDGELNKLPKNIQSIILDLQNDLVGGMNIFGNSKRFEINYLKKEGNQYVIYIYSGATFRGDYNGYNFDLVITNSIDSYHDGYEKTKIKDVYIETEINKEYRPSPFVLNYNSNSYDLLILKVFR